MGLLNHQALQIIKGVEPIPGYSTGAEQTQVNIDLMSNSPSGFSLVTWEPNIPSLKAGGVWADSPISDGRSLVAAQNTNVIELVTVQLTGANCQAFAANFSALDRMIQDARAFWDTTYQIEPVYLHWWAAGAPAPQYALIYSIDMKVTYQDSTQSHAELILSIEREPYWRGVTPGGNPKRWTRRLGNPAFASSNASLVSGSDHLVNSSMSNRLEYNVAGTALLSKNYIDIPANSIPGDAPALVEFYVPHSSGTGIVSDLIAGLTTKPDLPSTAGVTRLPNYCLNGGDCDLGTDTTKAADTGAPIRATTGANTRLNCTFATVTAEATRASWEPTNTGTYFDWATLRGRFMVFVRARLSAAGTVTLRLTTQGSTANITGPLMTLTDNGSGGTGNTTFWKAVYMGVMEFPPSQPVPILDNGTGIEIETVAVAPTLNLLAARTSGTPVLYISDVILIPIDEGSLAFFGSADLSAGNSFVFDDSGYFMHGKPNPYFDVSNGYVLDARMNNFYLRPNQRNRIVFLFTESFSTPYQSAVVNEYTISLNIVPRWIGIRDTA